MVGTVKALANSLWFPVLFFLGFLFCYLLAFHNPTPHDVRVAVPRAAAAQLQAGLDNAVPGGFEVVPVGTVGDAPETALSAVREAVLSRDALGGYVPGRAPTLFTAKAEGVQIVDLLQQVFTPIAEQTSPGARLQQVELAPTAPKDGTGTSMFYLSLALTIPSYVMVMMMLRATDLGRSRKIATFVVMGAVFAVVAYYVGRAMDVLLDKPVLMLYMFLLTQAVSLFCYGMVPFVRQFFPGVAVIVFVLLSMPASGGAFPVQMVPAFFRALHPYAPMGNLIDAMRDIQYYRGEKLFHPTLVLAVWIVLGIALLCAGFLWERHVIARGRADGEEESVGDFEAAVQDPALEMPTPRPVTAHTHLIGASQPMLAGKVTTTAAQPLSGVVVTVSRPDGHLLVRTRTDEHGEYRVTGLPDAYVDVLASGPGLVPDIKRVWCGSGRLVHQDFALGASTSDAG